MAYDLLLRRQIRKSFAMGIEAASPSLSPRLPTSSEALTSQISKPSPPPLAASPEEVTKDKILHLSPEATKLAKSLNPTFTGKVVKVRIKTDFLGEDASNGMYAFVHDIFERQQREPIVRHVFIAPTEKQARHYYSSHLASDRFLRECQEKGTFDNRVDCRSRTFLVKLTPDQVSALTEGRL